MKPKWRHPVERRFCDCGQPAVRVKSGTYICARCSELERIGYSVIAPLKCGVRRPDPLLIRA